jgi:hypothetical protein
VARYVAKIRREVGDVIHVLKLPYRVCVFCLNAKIFGLVKMIKWVACSACYGNVSRLHK